MTQGRNGHKTSSAGEHELDPAVLRLLDETRGRQTSPLEGRERTVELVAAGAFLLAAVAAALLLPSDRSFSFGLAAALVIVYALAVRVEFHLGASWTDPTQLVLVPMLFLLPTPLVPLLVALALVLAKLPEYVRREVNPGRAVVQIELAWYSLGPVLVLSLAGAAVPAWGDWPIYVAALAAQHVVDATVFLTVCRIGLGVRFRLQARELAPVYLVDTLLAPIGLLAAFAAQDEPYTALLIVPLIGLLSVFSRERRARIENAQTLGQAYRGTALLLGELLAASDEYTGAHSRSVVMLSHQVAVAMGLDERQMRDVEFGALLHDVGKMSVPKSILNKPGPLTDDEFAVVKGHTREGEDMLSRIGGVLAEAGYVVRTHHERFDGSGYPDGLKGDEIPISARIIACCDAFNAMTTDRPYRGAMPLQDALAELRANAGTQFDPRIVELVAGIVERSEPTVDLDAEAAALVEQSAPKQTA